MNCLAFSFSAPGPNIAHVRSLEVGVVDIPLHAAGLAVLFFDELPRLLLALDRRLGFAIRLRVDFRIGVFLCLGLFHSLLFLVCLDLLDLCDIVEYTACAEILYCALSIDPSIQQAHEIVCTREYKLDMMGNQNLGCAGQLGHRCETRPPDTHDSAIGEERSTEQLLVQETSGVAILRRL